MTSVTPTLLRGDEADLPPAVRDALPTEDAGYALARPTAAGWARAITHHGRRRLLEFGAGASSRVAAAALAHVGGGRLTTVEQDPDWCAGLWDAVLAADTIDADMIVAQRPSPRLNVHGLMHGYFDAGPAIAERGPYDAVLIDAPQGCYGRDACLWLALPRLTPGALVFLNDAARWKQRLTLDRWRRTLPSAELIDDDASVGPFGAAVLRIADPEDVSPALLGAASATLLFGVDAVARWRQPDRAAA